MGRITGNSNPLNQQPHEFQPASSNPQTVQPPLNLPSWSPPAAAGYSPAKPQPSFHQTPPPPQPPLRHPPMYYQQHQGSVGCNNQYPIVVAQTPNVRPEDWKTGLFDCMDDPSNAVITFFCPCVTFGQIAEIVDKGHTSCGTSGMLYGLVAFCTGLPCLISFAYRTKLRSQYGLVGSPAADSVVHLFCDSCALCQEYRELQLRGIDPSIGWLGNVAKNQSISQQYAMMPPMRQTMNG